MFWVLRLDTRLSFGSRVWKTARDESLRSYFKFIVLFFSPERRACEPCPNQFDIVDEYGQCITCEEGTFPNGAGHACTPCKANEILLFDDSCKPCAAGMVPSESHKFCKPCPFGKIAIGGICDSCPDPIKQ